MIGTIPEPAFFLLVPAAALWLEQHVRVVAVMGLVGCAVGNYLGLLVAWLLG